MNEAVALRVVKPLDHTGHLLSFLPASQRHVKRKSEGHPTDNGWTKLWSHTQRAIIGAPTVYHIRRRIDSPAGAALADRSRAGPASSPGGEPQAASRRPAPPAASPLLFRISNGARGLPLPPRSPPPGEISVPPAI